MKRWLLTLLLPACHLAGAGEASIAFQLSTRYAPYVDRASKLELATIAENQSSGWWQSPQAIKRRQSDLPGPLAGVHLALEAGHIGGDWAELEARHFRISERDYWVREGELVLEVAQRAAADLRRMGARVSLVRNSCHPLNPKTLQEYWAIAASEIPVPTEPSLAAQLAHAVGVRDRAIRKAFITGELIERARLVNESIRPDALISLHINAAPWPGPGQQLVDSDHAHALIFGSLMAAELSVPDQRTRLIVKMTNGSGSIEVVLGNAMGQALAEATGLPASEYSGDNAVRLQGGTAYLWARNLLLLRLVDCPAVMLEPYIANSKTSYPRIQRALHARVHHQPLLKDDLLIEYAAAVVDGVVRTYSGNLER